MFAENGYAYTSLCRMAMPTLRCVEWLCLHFVVCSEELVVTTVHRAISSIHSDVGIVCCASPLLCVTVSSWYTSDNGSYRGSILGLGGEGGAGWEHHFGTDYSLFCTHVFHLQMTAVLSRVSDSNLRNTLEYGIGLHHAGLQERDRKIVEELFVNLKIQVCTLLHMSISTCVASFSIVFCLLTFFATNT